MLLPMVHDTDMSAAMLRLAAELRGRGLAVKDDYPSSPNGMIRMSVRNPDAGMLAETIIGYGGSFWWPWQDRIASVSDIAAAAAAIVRVLAVTEPS